MPDTLAVAIAFFVRHDLSSGFRDYEISMCAARGSCRCCCGAIAGIIGVALEDWRCWHIGSHTEPGRR
jgi:hypothetical protein